MVMCLELMFLHKSLNSCEMIHGPLSGTLDIGSPNLEKECFGHYKISLAVVPDVG